jgi:D-aspartate ligase
MTSQHSEPPLDKNRPGVIVLGGNFLALGIVRSLGARGVPVWVIDSDSSKSIAQFSRYTTRFIVTEEPIQDVLIRAGREHQLNGWMIFPTNDQYVESVSTHHEVLSSMYTLTTPPLVVTKFALDKRLTYRKADELGIATPWTCVGTDAAAIDAKAPPYPLILKPAINHHFFPQTNIKALPVGDFADLQRRFAQMSKYISPDEVLVQERIPGGGENQFSFCAICKNGRAYAPLVAQRRRQYPLEFGNASTFVETTTQPDVEASGRLFLESIGHDGMAEVEFKFDPRDGKYKILDVNLRAWGWHTIGIAAGLDFAYLLWRERSGFDVYPHGTPRKAAWCREITDVVAILRSRDSVAEVKRLVRAMLKGKFMWSTFSIIDPVPFFAELVLLVSSGLSRQKKARIISS